MSSTREIVTLQLGHFSNFVGSHWWNIQESSFVYKPEDSSTKEINHDILYREGKNLLGEVTFTPRLVSLDLKGSLRSLKQYGTLYDATNYEDLATWHGDVTLHETEQVERNKFLSELDDFEEEADGRNDESIPKSIKDEENEKELASGDAPVEEPMIFEKRPYNYDDDVQVWSDFLRQHLHPKSVAVIEEYSHQSTNTPFNIFNLGQLIFSNRTFRDEIEDRLHFFVEECDFMQGFQVLVDPYDGFGGVACHLLPELADEYGKTLFTIGVSPSSYYENTPDADSHRVINSALSYTLLAEHSTTFLPLSCSTTLFRKPGPPVEIPYLSYKDNLSYHTASIIASALDTITLPSRLESNAVNMRDVLDSLSMLGRKVSKLMASIPFPIDYGSSLVDQLMLTGSKLPWVSLSAVGPSGSCSPFMQSVVLRGTSDQLVQSSNRQNIPPLLQDCKKANEVMSLFCSEVYPNTASGISTLSTPMKTTKPFPHIFQRHINENGHVSGISRPEDKGVNEVPVLAALQSDPSSGIMLTDLYKQAKRLNIRKMHGYLEADMEMDDYFEILENLQTLGQAYLPSTDMP